MKLRTLTSLLLLFSIALFISSCDEPVDDEDKTANLGKFNFVQFDTHYEGDTSMSHDSLVVMHGEIISLSETDQELTVTRVGRVLTDSTWSTAICVGPVCLPPFLDRYTFTLKTGDTASFSLDTFSWANPGEASWTIFAVDSTTMEIDSVNVSMEVVLATH